MDEENAARTHECTTGELKLLRQLNRYEFAVEVKVMREGLNNNKWDYRGLKDYYLSFLGQPILIAYVGTKIGDGHNMRAVKLPDGGTEYTFVDGTAERIIGTLSEDPKDFRLEEIDGYLWMIAKGRIFSFYAREAVEKIIVTGAMAVSAETEIYEADNGVNGVEIFKNWAGLGVTILGDDVPPAIPGARIRAMSVRDDLEGMMLRAASLLQEADESPMDEKKEKGVNKGMNKRQIAHLQKQFNGFTVLNASEDGMRICLASEENGAPYGYVFKDDEDKAHVFDERIFPMRVNAAFAFDSENSVEVDVETILDNVSAKLVAANALNEENAKKIESYESEIATLKAEKAAWRIREAKTAVMSRLDALNKDRDARCAYSRELADGLCAKIETGCFNECMNEKGEWCGDQLAVMELEATCAREQEKMDKANAEKARKAMNWNTITGGDADETGTLDALLDYATK